MESRIKVKATQDQMEVLCRAVCVKSYEFIKRLDDKKNRGLYDVYLRHADDLSKLKGVYTAEYIIKAHFPECVDCFSWYINQEFSSIFQDCETFLSSLGNKHDVIGLINEALQKHKKNYRLLKVKDK